MTLDTGAYVYLCPSLAVCGMQGNFLKGGATRSPSQEPYVLITNIIHGEVEYAYVLGRTHVGWFPTWRTDERVELIYRA
jgi:hypothetical protein